MVSIDLIFTIFFSFELSMRIFVERLRFLLGRNKLWNAFDTLVVTSAVLEECVKASTNTTAIRVMRIMRLVRVIRVIRTLRLFKDLRALVTGIFASLISLVWALVLLLVILFVNAVFITQMVTTYRSQAAESDLSSKQLLVDHFGSLGYTMYSLYKAITGGEDWALFADALFEVSDALGVFFCAYIAFSIFAVLNVITGVFVDNAIRANQQDADVIIMEQTEARKKHIDDVKSVFEKADSDGSGTLTWEEFQTHVENPYVQAYFRQIGLELAVDDARTIFSLLDFDGGGCIDLDEFIFGCGHLKGFATSMDLARMGHAQRQQTNKLIARANEQADHLEGMVQKISTLLEQSTLQKSRTEQISRNLKKSRSEQLSKLKGPSSNSIKHPVTQTQPNISRNQTLPGGIQAPAEELS